MGRVIQFEEVPPRSQGTCRHQFNNCNHRRLRFDLLTKTVECRACGKQWKDYVGDAKLEQQLRQL